MSLKNLADVCSHLNNACKARLSITSIPNNKMHQRLCVALQNSGYIRGIVIGGPKNPPQPHIIHNQPVFTEEEPVTQENVASRRLWLGLKYWQSEPVLGKMSLISKPKKRVTLKLSSLRRLVQGHNCDGVGGLRSPGESLYLSTDQGILEARECVERGHGGLVLCRVR